MMDSLNSDFGREEVEKRLVILEEAKGGRRIVDDCDPEMAMGAQEKEGFSAARSPVQEPVVASNVSCVAFNSSIIKSMFENGIEIETKEEVGKS